MFMCKIKNLKIVEQREKKIRLPQNCFQIKMAIFAAKKEQTHPQKVHAGQVGEEIERERKKKYEVKGEGLGQVRTHA